MTQKDFLNQLQGRVKTNHPLSTVTWFQVGGDCDAFFTPENEDALSQFFKHKPNDMPWTILGAGSNTLIHDDGISGCVIKLGRGFSEITIDDGTADNATTDGATLIVGGGALDRTIAMTAMEHGLSNLEFLVGIPGSCGGAIAMNAGAYGHEIKDHILWADIMDDTGVVKRLNTCDFSMSYRKGHLPKNCIVLRAGFSMTKKDPKSIHDTLESYLKMREDSQPTRGRTGGSTFKNPDGHSAWKLIDAAGCRGLKIGNAQVSEKHCNFLLNLGGATASDIETLGETVRKRVLQTSGVDLEWEIIRLGRDSEQSEFKRVA